MKRIALLLELFCVSVCLSAQVTLNPAEEIGQIKPMNGVNNGPVMAPKSQSKGNDVYFRAAGIPFARVHDSYLCNSYGGNHTVDVTAIFPDFSKNPDDPSSYDFAVTDKYMSNIAAVGTAVFYRLGESIDHKVKKYNVYPPKDFKKWAKICEHIILHYNEGWNNGFHYGIEYWEIWNEPDLDRDEKNWKYAPRTWGGSHEQFFDFFETVSKYLDKRFPELKIGGPALCESIEWAAEFIPEMARRNVPMDFFSWHIYTTTPEKMISHYEKLRALLDANGYGGIESICDEWNYVRNWNTDFVYSLDVISSVKGAAFTSACFSAAQNSDISKLLYYDARPNTSFNGLFSLNTLRPLAGYYPFYFWSKLAGLGTQIAVDEDEDDLYAVAAKSDDGQHFGMMLTRFSDDDNITSPKRVEIDLGSAVAASMITALVIDDFRIATETPLAVENGRVTIEMLPRSVFYLDIK